MYKIKYFIVIGVIVSWVLAACQNPVEHTAPAIQDRDSVAMMTSYGVNTLISDSGVIKYRIVTERWEVNTNRVPSRWIFDKGMLLEQFDEKFHINSYIQCDTAYYFDQERVWKLYGRVRILTKDGLRFTASSLPGMRTSTNSPAMYSASWLLRSVPFRVPISGAMSV